MGPAHLEVSLVCVWPDWQYLRQFRVRPGTTVAQLLAQSDLAAQVAAQGRVLPAELGIFGRRVADPEQRVLQQGDRVELYRPLLIDPKDIRRLRAVRHPVGRCKPRQPPPAR